VPRRSVILIEDVDAFFQQRSKADTGVKVSYSGFINALDGVAAHEGSVVFLTTNHPQLIDEAAIRSGRVDFRLELGLCDRDQLARMCAKFFPDPAAAARFADAVPADRWSPAQVQERLLKAASAEEGIALFRDRETTADVAVLRAA
jgi:chaperone BCS1